MKRLTARRNGNFAIMMEGLETRQLMSGTPGPQPPQAPPTPEPAPVEAEVKVTIEDGKVLRIIGTDGNDGVTIRAQKSNKLLINANGKKHVFNLSQVKRIVADLGKGNDVFADRSSRNIVCKINGGEGNDDLLGGIRGDRLNGGAGDDSVTGGNGADVLSGDAGLDVIVSLDGPLESVGTLNTPAADEINALDGGADHILRDDRDTAHTDGNDVFKKPEEVLARFRPKPAPPTTVTDDTLDDSIDEDSLLS
jgi:Ca2+-binding RTX toxin-like protein